MVKPLADLLVIELSTMITASFAAMQLAEQGARVIKVEPMEMGDPMRHLGTAKGGISGLFANCNRGKESLRINLKEPEGQQVVQTLAEKADVLIHNFRPGVMDQLQLGSSRLRAANPRLIYCAISGFGTAGPLAGAPAYDPIVQAHTGMTDVQGDEGHAFIRNLICDKVTAYTACQAVTSALYQRERTGNGEHIDISMLDAGLFFIFPDGFMADTLLDADAVPGPEIRNIYRKIRLKDGEITISAANQKQMFGVLKAIGREDLTTPEGMPELMQILAIPTGFEDLINTAIADWTTEQALANMLAADVPCARCLDRAEVLAQPQLAANNTLAEVDHPHMGKLRAVRSPVRFGGAQFDMGRPCPAHGEHTHSILQEAGLSAAEIETLARQQIVAPSAG
jgi:crotonobetainyl-CoA:carnitine CoA-transferase CaiB-like acyl-CoA transferase